ncbi:hypothetical protein MMC28_011750 [Mycoblastus sanguinarius]|nr:hypothetical protein [Mycoblastus sanguinarius]
MSGNQTAVSELRIVARKYVQEITASNPTDLEIRVVVPVNTRGISLKSLVRSLNVSGSKKEGLQLFEDIVVLDALLAEKRDCIHSPSDQDAAVVLREWLAHVILPTKAFAERSPYATENETVLVADELEKARVMNLKGLSLMSHLQKLTPLSKDESNVKVLTCLAAFTDENDPWTCPGAQKKASVLIKDYLNSSNQPILFSRLLQERVRPLFARSKNPAITPQGRKAINPLPSTAIANSDLDDAVKPWKYRDVYIVTVFQWVLDHLDESSVESNWPLIIPPLLTLIDDSSITQKAKGCTLLNTFLQSCPPLLLQRTGLGEVFETALMSCLLYLPSLTEEVDSLHILKAAYRALISLAVARFPGDEQQVFRMRTLDRILQLGVFKGYAHAGEHVRIAELLVDQITELTNKMGIESVKYLRHFLPLLSANLASPFPTAYPPLIRASVRALKAVMVNGWQRIAIHRGEILRGLTVCWCRIVGQDKESEELKETQERVEEAVRVLTSLIKSDVNISIGEEYQTLIENDGRLQELLIY